MRPDTIKITNQGLKYEQKTQKNLSSKPEGIERRPSGSRTLDTLIKSQVLYQLS